MEEKEGKFVNTPLDLRQMDALEFIKNVMGNGPDLKVANVDAMRAALISHARTLGWQDPNVPASSASPSRRGA